MSQGSLKAKIRFLGQKVCPAARERTDRQTHTKVTTMGTVKEFSFNLSSRIGLITILETNSTQSCNRPLPPKNIIIRKTILLHPMFKMDIQYTNHSGQTRMIRVKTEGYPHEFRSFLLKHMTILALYKGTSKDADEMSKI